MVRMVFSLTEAFLGGSRKAPMSISAEQYAPESTPGVLYKLDKCHEVRYGSPPLSWWLNLGWPGYPCLAGLATYNTTCHHS